MYKYFSAWNSLFLFLLACKNCPNYTKFILIDIPFRHMQTREHKMIWVFLVAFFSSSQFFFFFSLSYFPFCRWTLSRRSTCHQSFTVVTHTDRQGHQRCLTLSFREPSRVSVGCRRTNPHGSVLNMRTRCQWGDTTRWWEAAPPSEPESLWLQPPQSPVRRQTLCPCVSLVGQKGFFFFFSHCSLSSLHFCSLTNNSSWFLTRNVAKYIKARLHHAWCKEDLN